MPNKLQLRGFDELRAELRALPHTLNRSAAPILLRRARTAQTEVVGAYPSITGELRAGVQIVARAARGIATLYTLVTGAPHAHIYEFGSARQPPRATFLPISLRERRTAVSEVVSVVKAAGLKVTGENN